MLTNARLLRWLAKGMGLTLTTRTITYIGAATLANRGLGAGAYVAGPLIGIAGATVDMAAEAGAKSFNNCNCGK
jgi:hypothetical protein